MAKASNLLSTKPGCQTLQTSEGHLSECLYLKSPVASEHMQGTVFCSLHEWCLSSQSRALGDSCQAFQSSPVRSALPP